MINEFWRDCLARMKWDENKSFTGTICFGTNADEAQLAIDEILRGDKCSHIYPLNGYRCAMKGPAESGQVNIVLDWYGVPRAAIETLEVNKLCLASLSDEDCALEGSAMNLEKWREQRLGMIKTEIEELGNELTDATMLVVEKFRVVHSA